MKNTDRLELTLKDEYGDNVTVDKIAPLHDEDFIEGYVVCVNNVIVCGADLSLKDICEAIEKIQSKEVK